jgi:2,3-bisphosphoglycerate-independent phosphoglycerate mutase
VRTYDLKPEMSALQVTEQLLSELKATNYQLVVCNFANCDMVGHTGNLRAAIQAVETVDGCLGKILDWVESKNAIAIITADHGNCEMMLAPDGHPLTSHTMQPVPFILVDNQHKAAKLAPHGRLCDIAPTILALWGMKQPHDMTGVSLLEKA